MYFNKFLYFLKIIAYLVNKHHHLLILWLKVYLWFFHLNYLNVKHDKKISYNLFPIKLNSLYSIQYHETLQYLVYTLIPLRDFFYADIKDKVFMLPLFFHYMEFKYHYELFILFHEYIINLHNFLFVTIFYLDQILLSGIESLVLIGLQSNLLFVSFERYVVKLYNPHEVLLNYITYFNVILLLKIYLDV